MVGVVAVGVWASGIGVKGIGVSGLKELGKVNREDAGELVKLITAGNFDTF